MNAGKPLVIICEDAEQEGLAFLAMNNYQKKLQVCVVRSPEIGQARMEWMEDIALLTGATYISDIRGVDVKKVNESHLGKAKKAIISKSETIIIDGLGDKVALEDFVNDLRMNLTQAETEEEKHLIEKRIARLTGGVAVIQVGGATETELQERLDRVDDSVRATKSAISEGFVAGGGTAFLRIKSGNELVDLALAKPLLQICENAGVDSKMVHEKVSAASLNVGYNVLTGNIEDMVESGIIDSTKALRCALQNAASVAGMILTSECSIITTH